MLLRKNLAQKMKEKQENEIDDPTRVANHGTRYE